MAAYGHTVDTHSQQVALAASIAFVLAQGNADLTDDVISEAFRLARKHSESPPPTRIHRLDLEVDETLMMAAAAHKHGEWILQVLQKIVTTERMPMVTEEVMMAAMGGPDFGSGVVSLLPSRKYLCYPTGSYQSPKT